MEGTTYPLVFNNRALLDISEALGIKNWTELDQLFAGLAGRPPSDTFKLLWAMVRQHKSIDFEGFIEFLDTEGVEPTEIAAALSAAYIDGAQAPEKKKKVLRVT